MIIQGHHRIKCLNCESIIIRSDPNGKTSPKGFPASKCDVGNWIFSKSWEFFGNSFEIFWEFYGNSLLNFLRILWEILGNFLCNFLGILWEFFGNSLGILWDSLGILKELFENSLGIISEFFGDVWLGVLNVWVLILGDKEVRFDLMVDNYKKRSLEVRSLSART